MKLNSEYTNRALKNKELNDRRLPQGNIFLI